MDKLHVEIFAAKADATQRAVVLQNLGFTVTPPVSKDLVHLAVSGLGDANFAKDIVGPNSKPVWVVSATITIA